MKVYTARCAELGPKRLRLGRFSAHRGGRPPGCGPPGEGVLHDPDPHVKKSDHHVHPRRLQLVSVPLATLDGVTRRAHDASRARSFLVRLRSGVGSDASGDRKRTGFCVLRLARRVASGTGAQTSVVSESS